VKTNQSENLSVPPDTRKPAGKNNNRYTPRRPTAKVNAFFVEK
jgi:hypothetical protein